MSSLLAHGLASLTIYKATERPCGLPRRLPGTALGFDLGLIPDLDVLARMALPHVFNHRGPSHSIAFAVALAMLCALAVSHRSKSGFLKPWLALSLACLAHPFLDWLMGCGPGVPFFWPVSDAVYLSPIQLVPTAYYSSSVKGLLGLFNHTPTLQGMAIELVIFLSLLAVAGYIGKLPNAGQRSGLALTMLAISGAGVYLTTTLY